MSAGRFHIPNAARNSIIGNTMDITAGLYYAVLLDTAHTPSDIVDTTLANLTNEIVDVDYARLNLTSVVHSQTGGLVTIDADDIDFGAVVTISARYLYIVQGTIGGSAGTDLVLCYCDLNADGAANVSSSNGPFQVLLSANGLFQMDEVLPPPVTALGTVTAGLVVDANTADSVTITNSGAAYLAPPVVTFSVGSGSTATGTAIMSEDFVVGVNITTPGSYLDLELPILVTFAAP